MLAAAALLPLLVLLLPGTAVGTATYYVFVAGMEGSGHHGVVHTLLQGLANETCLRAAADQPPDVGRHVDVRETPWYDGHGTNGWRDPYVKLAWESLPSQRAHSPGERLEMLYERPECLHPHATEFPKAWSGTGRHAGGDCLTGGTPRGAFDHMKQALRGHVRHLDVNKVLAAAEHQSPGEVRDAAAAAAWRGGRGQA